MKIIAKKTYVKPTVIKQQTLAAITATSGSKPPA